MKFATLVLADGTVMEGQAFGTETDSVFELVFNTSMTGYQEILTDPSYRGQEAIIAQEKPDAMLPTVGGQTGLNLALALSENGVLEKYGVQLIGAKLSAIQAAEDRMLFRETMQKNDMPVPHGGALLHVQFENPAILLGR